MAEIVKLADIIFVVEKIPNCISLAYDSANFLDSKRFDRAGPSTHPYPTLHPGNMPAEPGGIPTPKKYVCKY
jgi:hypothetical protein